MKLPSFESVGKILGTKASYKALNPKARKWTARFLVCSLYSLIVALACAAAVGHNVPRVEIFQLLGLASVFAWVTLTFLAVASDITGSVISRAERYHKFNPAVQKFTKNVFSTQTSALRVASYRAGNSRARRSPSRSNASKDSSGGGDSDSSGGEGDPPAPISLPALSLRPYLISPHSLYKLNNSSLPWRFLFAPGCRHVTFNPLFTKRGWSK